jgi:AcrR family transcriptional regulator
MAPTRTTATNQAVEPLQPAELLAERRRPGRPRDAGADDAILGATIELLADGGIAGLSMDLVAKRAGVGKATIYRRWASKEELVLDALSTAPEAAPTPDTGSVRGDLVAWARALAMRFRDVPTNDVLPHLIEAAVFDERVRESLQAYVRGRQETVKTILRRGVERGELTNQDDIELMVDVMIAPFLYRRLMTGGPITTSFATRLADFVLSRTG